ncbi:H2.0-like homeobox protein [Bienertia sinuspersici]
MWLKEPSCIDVIRQGWENGEDCQAKIRLVTSKLRSWSREAFSNFAKELKAYKIEMEKLMKEDQTKEILGSQQLLDLKSWLALERMIRNHVGV